MEQICNKIIELLKNTDQLMIYNGQWIIRNETLAGMKPETLEILRYCIVSIGTWA